MLQHEPPFARVGLLTVLLLTGLFPFLQGQGGCGQPPLSITITSPADGIFSNAGSIVVTGTINKAVSIHTVDVNGVPATLLADKTWSATIPLDSVAVFNTLKATVTNINNLQTKKDIVTVIAGDSLGEDDLAPDAVAVRINESALDGLQPLLEDLVTLDVATLIPVGTVIANQCFIDSFLGCTGSAVVSVSNPAPTISGFTFDLDSQVNQLLVEPQIQDLEIHTYIDGSGLVPNCGLRVNANALDIDAYLDMEPGDPLDVIQNGNVTTAFVGFSHTFTSGVCDWPIIGDIIQALLPDIQTLARDGVAGFLNTVDGNGNTALAGAFETALTDIDITGPISELLGAELSAPISVIAEDVDGATIALDTKNIPTCTPPPGTPDLTRSYAVGSPFPSFGPTTPPPGNNPYGLGVCLSANAFNQLLRTLTECGLLNLQLTEIDLFGSPQPITAGLLSLFVPELASIDGATPMTFDASAQLAPIITDQPGPAGEDVALKLGDLQLALNVVPPTPKPMVTVSIGASVGVELDFNQTTNTLDFVISNPTPGSLQVEIIQNAIGTNETTLELVLESVLPQFFPSIIGALGSLPIPSIAGLDIVPVEPPSRNGEFISIYGDAVPIP